MKSSRLKNFCEACRKQCKDENGYHCHLNSGHHQKKLRELATNPEEHLEKYSRELQNRILQMLKVKYPGEAKDIEDIYKEYTEEKHYVRFNHTHWKDLGEFVEHLRKTGRNLHIVGKMPNVKITYLVSKSADFIKKKREEELFEKKEKQKEMMQSRMEERVARNREIEEEIFKQMKRKVQEEQDKLEEFVGDRLELRFNTEVQSQKRSSLFNVEEAEKEMGDVNYAPKKIKNVERLFEKLEDQQKKRQKEEQPENNTPEEFEWVTAGIVVKVLPHDIPQVFHGKKTPILEVKEPYVASVQIGNANLEIDQSFLETVIPKVGHQVKLLRGDLRGVNGVLREINLEGGSGTIETENGQVVAPFNQFSKCS